MTLKNTFAVLGPNGRAVAVDVTDDLHERLDREFDNFSGHSLVACHTFQSDWPTWEMHPAGDEVVCLLSGEARLVLDHGDRHEEIALDEPLAFAIVPRGTWHTAKTKTGCTMLFITPGEGTENKDA
ncbi:MAG: cupin [Gammaproteobacteria bacterium]|nr:cupin [Gammaproteobacteria bacterium]MBT8444651.1 cupin [Gammaproteobacteria bacterium]NND36470.1 cupin [Gammaproteobacteria bacterium]